MEEKPSKDLQEVRDWVEEMLKDKPISDRGFTHSLLWPATFYRVEITEDGQDYAVRYVEPGTEEYWKMYEEQIDKHGKENK